jgi:hypothetical protein
MISSVKPRKRDRHFGQVLQTAQAQEADDVFGREVRKLLAERVGSKLGGAVRNRLRVAQR